MKIFSSLSVLVLRQKPAMHERGGVALWTPYYAYMYVPASGITTLETGSFESSSGPCMWVCMMLCRCIYMGWCPVYTLMTRFFITLSGTAGDSSDAGSSSSESMLLQASHRRQYSPASIGYREWRSMLPRRAAMQNKPHPLYHTTGCTHNSQSL